MRIIRGSREEVCAAAADEVIRLVERKAGCVLALSAADALTPVYTRLAASGADFSSCRVFLTEEFAGLTAGAPGSRGSRLSERLLKPAGFSPEKVYFPPTRGDMAAECAAYDALAEEAGGIDFVLLAVGVNGCVAFNEPLAAFDSGTRLTKLTESTRSEECADMDGESPAEGVTMGMRCIMRARSVALVAFGADRSEIVHRAVNGPAHISVPASLLQLHTDTRLYLDDAAAGLLV